jgi:UMF1 family MFS transporter
VPLPPSSLALVVAAFLTIIGGASYAVATVCNNAYLPLLAKLSPEVQETLEREQESETTELLSDDSPVRTKHSNVISMAISRISAKGTALGFGSGVVLLALLTIPVMVLKGSTGSLRLAVGISGIWWAVFTVPAARYLPAAKREGDAAWTDIGKAWKRLGGMIRLEEMRRLRNTYMFLLAWIFLSDGELTSVEQY